MLKSGLAWLATDNGWHWAFTLVWLWLWKCSCLDIYNTLTLTVCWRSFFQDGRMQNKTKKKTPSPQKKVSVTTESSSTNFGCNKSLHFHSFNQTFTIKCTHLSQWIWQCPSPLRSKYSGAVTCALFFAKKKKEKDPNHWIMKNSGKGMRPVRIHEWHCYG